MYPSVSSKFMPHALFMASDIKKSLEEKKIWTNCWLFPQQFNLSHKHEISGNIHILCSHLSSVKSHFACVFFTYFLITNTAVSKHREASTGNEGWYCISFFCIVVESGWGLWISKEQHLYWQTAVLSVTLSSTEIVNMDLMVTCCVSTRNILD